MKRLTVRIIAMLALCVAGMQAQTTTLTGTVRDLTNSVVTSGQATFTLRPSLDTTQSGTARFTPLTVTCTITGAGLIKALDGVSACVLVNNTSLTPSGTSYLACLQPFFVTPGSCFNFYALGTATDLTTVVPTPTTSPAFTFVDLFSAQTISGAKTFTGAVTLSGALTLGAVGKLNGFYYVDGTTYTTIQAAITAACAATPSGGTVYIPPGNYTQSSSFTLCSNINIIGSGRCQVDAGNCPTMISSTITSGDLFPITNMTDIHMSDFGIKNTASAGANAAIRLNYGQRVVVERLYISGLFARGIELDTSSTSTGSTIRNHFEDIFMTGLAPASIGCLLNSSDATTKVINNNRFIMVGCQGGTGASVGLKVTNSNVTQNINENLFYGDQFSTTDGSAGTGIGIQFTSTATRGMVFESSNVESNGTGLNKATGNTVTFVGGNFSSNGTQTVDSQPTFTQFFGTNVQGIVQQFEVLPIGGINVDGVGIKAAPDSGNINGLSGWALEASGTTVGTVRTTDLTLSKKIILPAGTCAAPSLTMATDNTTGFLMGGSGNIEFTSASNCFILWATNLVRQGSGVVTGYSATADPSGTASDVNTSRAGVGIIQVGTGETANANGQLRLARVRASGGNAVVTGDFVLNASWGNTATKSAISGTDSSGTISVTANGAGIAANPTITFTFHDGAWSSQPVCALTRNDTSGVAAGSGAVVGGAGNTTSTILGLFGTATAGNTYIFTWVCM